MVLSQRVAVSPVALRKSPPEPSLWPVCYFELRVPEVEIHTPQVAPRLASAPPAPPLVVHVSVAVLLWENLRVSSSAVRSVFVRPTARTFFFFFFCSTAALLDAPQAWFRVSRVNTVSSQVVTKSAVRTLHNAVFNPRSEEFYRLDRCASDKEGCVAVSALCCGRNNNVQDLSQTCPAVLTTSRACSLHQRLFPILFW